MKRESKMTILSIVGLLLVSLGLWGYQTFIVPKQKESLYTEVYLASQDIPTNATIKDEMLEPVRVNEDSVVPGAIKDKSEATGKRAIAGILKGELIQEQRLSDDLIDQGELFIRVEPDYEIDIADGDQIRVFTFVDGELDVLFERKEVFGVHRIANLLEGQTASGFYLQLSEQEVKNYYAARTNSGIVLSKIQSVATDEDIANGTGEPIVFTGNDAPENSDSVESNKRYTVKENQSLEDIAYELEVSPEELVELNDGLTEVQEGDVIVIP